MPTTTEMKIFTWKTFLYVHVEYMYVEIIKDAWANNVVLRIVWWKVQLHKYTWHGWEMDNVSV